MGIESGKLNYEDLLGAKWKQGGQSIGEGFDCWSLAGEIYRRLYAGANEGGFETRPYGAKKIGVIGRSTLPDYRHLEEQIMAGGKFQYERVDAMIRDRKYLFERLLKPEPFCLVTFRLRPPFVTHIGVVLGDCKRFIHILKQSSVSVERLDSILWEQKIDGFWKYEKKEINHEPHEIHEKKEDY